VKIDNCDEELDMDAHMGKAVQLPQLDYTGEGKSRNFGLKSFVDGGIH
jgi:hypothetical protein